MDAVLKHWKIFCFDDFTGNPKVLRNPCIWPYEKRKWARYRKKRTVELRSESFWYFSVVNGDFFSYSIL